MLENIYKSIIVSYYDNSMLTVCFTIYCIRLVFFIMTETVQSEWTTKWRIRTTLPLRWITYAYDFGSHIAKHATVMVCLKPQWNSGINETKNRKEKGVNCNRLRQGLWLKPNYHSLNNMSWDRQGFGTYHLILFFTAHHFMATTLTKACYVSYWMLLTDLWQIHLSRVSSPSKPPTLL